MHYISKNINEKKKDLLLIDVMFYFIPSGMIPA